VLPMPGSAFGDPKWTVTRWPESTGERQEPGCGAVYQPYGPVEIAWTTCLVSTLEAISKPSVTR
jgi:hypothetical protein